MGEQKSSEGLDGDDRVPARQADDHGAMDVVRPQNILVKFRNWTCIYDGKDEVEGRGALRQAVRVSGT